jgi:hypothetical protein
MTSDLGTVDLSEVTGFVDEDPGMVVRGARVATPADRAVIREQTIARMLEAHRRERARRSA